MTVPSPPLRASPSGTVTPQPVLPDYGRANLATLLPALMEGPDLRPDWLPDVARQAAQVVVLLVDGLGWLQLKDRWHLAPNLAAMIGEPITSVVPSTTAVALTSLTVGAAPAVHGIVGYRLAVEGPTGPEVLNVLRWRTVSGDARPFLDPKAFQPVEPFRGRPVPVVSRSEFSGSGFTIAHQRDAPVSGWWLPSSLAVEVRDLIAKGEPLVYAYYEGVDKIAHIKGFGPHYDAEVAALDRLVGDLLDVLPPDAALLVTADHGQVEVGARVVALGADLLDAASLVSGEGRFRWLHARPGAAEWMLAAATARYGDQAWVVTAEQMEADGWFGGPLDPHVRARLGDVALIPWEPIAFLDPADTGEARLVCRHGSLTEDEMMVPLVAGAGRLDTYG